MNTKDYIDLRFEDIRLKGSDTASQVLGSVLSYILIVIVAGIVLTLLAFGLVLLLGEQIGNYALGAFIVCGAFLVVLVALWICRKKMFRGAFIRLLSGKRNRAELQRSQDIVAARLSDAEKSDVLGISALGLRAIGIALKLLVRRK